MKPNEIRNGSKDGKALCICCGQWVPKDDLSVGIAFVALCGSDGDGMVVIDPTKPIKGPVCVKCRERGIRDEAE